jgi:hypothetical protein
LLQAQSMTAPETGASHEPHREGHAQEKPPFKLAVAAAVLILVLWVSGSSILSLWLTPVIIAVLWIAIQLGLAYHQRHHAA